MGSPTPQEFQNFLHFLNFQNFLNFSRYAQIRAGDFGRRRSSSSSTDNGFLRFRYAAPGLAASLFLAG